MADTETLASSAELLAVETQSVMREHAADLTPKRENQAVARWRKLMEETAFLLDLYCRGDSRP